MVSRAKGNNHMTFSGLELQVWRTAEDGLRALQPHLLCPLRPALQPLTATPAACGSPHIPSVFPPQGLCTGRSPWLRLSYPRFPCGPSDLLKCHLLRVFQTDHSI